MHQRVCFEHVRKGVPWHQLGNRLWVQVGHRLHQEVQAGVGNPWECQDTVSFQKGRWRQEAHWLHHGQHGQVGLPDCLWSGQLHDLRIASIQNSLLDAFHQAWCIEGFHGWSSAVPAIHIPEVPNAVLLLDEGFGWWPRGSPEDVSQQQCSQDQVAQEVPRGQRWAGCRNWVFRSHGKDFVLLNNLSERDKFFN